MRLIKVNHFKNRREKELTGLANSIPLLVSIFATYLLYQIEQQYVFVGLGFTLVVLSATLIKVWIFNNSKLEITTKGILLKKINGSINLSWLNINRISFHKNESDTFFPAIIMEIEMEKSTVNIIVEKNLFTTPMKKYLVILNLIQSSAPNSIEVKILKHKNQ